MRRRIGTNPETIARRERMSGLLLGLMNWSFSGEVEARMELCDREVMRHEKRASKTIT